MGAPVKQRQDAERAKRKAEMDALMAESRAAEGTKGGPGKQLLNAGKYMAIDAESGLRGLLNLPKDASRPDPGAGSAALEGLAAPDLTDETLRRVRRSAALRATQGRNRKSTFLTGPGGVTRPPSLLGGGY